MRKLRYLFVLLVVLDFLDPTGGIFYADSAAAQALPIPLIQGPYDPSQGLQTFNSLILQLNGILVPAFGQTVTPAGAAVNQVSLTGGVTGTNATIGLQPGADANAGIQIKPNGSGNLVLFSTLTNGAIQIASTAGWYPAKGAGLVQCPGGGALTGPATLAPGLLPGGAQTIVGYEVHENWLGLTYWIPGCH